MAVDESYYPDPEESREDPGHQANTIQNFYHVNPTLFARLIPNNNAEVVEPG